MSDEIKDGGPAFPVPPDQVTTTRVKPGMSLLDYFAAEAMQAKIISCGSMGVSLTSDNIPHFANESYMIAAAMLNAREFYNK